MFTKAYPEDKDLRRAFIEMNKWTRFKQDILKTVKSESVNKKEYILILLTNFL